MPNEKKIILVGDTGCGKISLIFNFFVDHLPDPAVPNIYKEYHTEIEIDGQNVPIELWIVPAQECYSKMRIVSYEGTEAVILCFAIDNPDSLMNVRDMWLPEIREHLPRVPVVLVGNKMDLRTNENVAVKNTSQKLISIDSGKEVAYDIKAEAYIECSARNGDNVKDVFRAAVQASLKSA